MTRPNVLVIQTDQYRWECMGAYGNAQVRTPHLDAIAADGVRYTSSFATYPACTPSRYSLLCGLYVHQHLGWRNGTTLPPGIDTFARALRRAGYRTRVVGKMHFSPTYLDVGYDEMVLAEQAGDGRFDDDYHRDLMAHGLVDADDIIDQRQEYRRRAPDSYWASFGAKTSNLPEEWHSTTWIGDRAVRALEEWDEQTPSLLHVSFIKPHHPFDPPAPWDRMYAPEALELLPGWLAALPARDGEYNSGYFPHERLTEPALRRVMALYYGTISHIDYQVGRMVETLKRKGLYENTLIVFTADHGDYLGFHHMLLKSGHMYDPLIKVPLLVKFPGQARAGEAHDALVSNVDVAPTILRRCGVDQPPAMQGLDLADPAASREYVFAEARRGEYMVRSRSHKLLLSRNPAHTLFFDLDDDPLELNDLSQDPAAASEVRRHRDALADWLLFDAVPPAYQDHDAPIIRQPNARHPRDGHRPAVAAYFARQTEPYLRRGEPQ